MGSPLTIGIINAKGGVGKTTTAIHLGVALANKGVEVWDADPQGSATEWAQHAQESTEPLPFEVQAVNVPYIRKTHTRKPITIIDSPPGDKAILAAIAERVDVCIIPTAPSGADIERVFSTVESLPDGKAVIVLLTDADPRTVLYRETVEAIKAANLAIFDEIIRPRQAVKAAYGTTPHELNGYDNVAQELIELMEITQ